MRIAVVGPGRLGHALVRALDEAGRFDVLGPMGRGADGHEADAVLLCVPDHEIAAAAPCLAPGRLVGSLLGGDWT